MLSRLSESRLSDSAPDFCGTRTETAPPTARHGEVADIGDRNWEDVNVEHYHTYLLPLENYGYVAWNEAENSVGRDPNETTSNR